MKKIRTWIKLDHHFIDQDNIRSITRLGNKTRIERILGDAIVVDIDYKKIVGMLPSKN